MPWVRIDENAMDHPKIGTLPDGAFRLWVQGLAYCQKHLTDGVIADAFVRELGAYSPKRQQCLIAAKLWHRARRGIRVHDFLQWNDSRADVLQKRQDAKDRMREKRSRERSSELSSGSQERSGERSQNVPSYVDVQGSSSEGGAGETAPPDWFAECQRLHAGSCGGSLKHRTLMLIEGQKAKGA